jgi:hypothetical protein
MESLGFHLILSSLSALPDSYCIESRNQEENKNPSVRIREKIDGKHRETKWNSNHPAVF